MFIIIFQRVNFLRRTFDPRLLGALLMPLRRRGAAAATGIRRPRAAPGPSERLERVKGIEPSSSAWKAVALPLSYTRICRAQASFLYTGSSLPATAGSARQALGARVA